MREEFVKFVNLHGLSGHAYTMALWAFETGHAAGMERAAEICEARLGQGGMEYDQDALDREDQACAAAIRAEIKGE
ncbi:hypothetical protein E5S69_32195 [Cupriavidus necator]|uniref:hypothetical protein n=1 Tax=Cupriavidus necator TaxID=106590 RepID=UPI001490470E|nr:hypothetical protein [Cupriavidus necator]NOV28146.1 hypothetical protein [Cupriavidus necator]